MSFDRHTRLTEIFLEACELPPEERAAFLERIFARDSSLRPEVEAMLAFEAAVPDFLEDGPRTEQADEGEAASARVLERLQKRIGKESRYQILGEFARGGMGVILKVWDHDLRRTLAMKVVLGRRDKADAGSTPAVDDKSLGRFLEEAQVTGQLDHPGIVPVHELGMDTEGQVYFTMRLVKGIELRQVFERVRDRLDGWTHSRAVGTILKVCEAMAYAHAKGVIHRDLKPANIMVGKFGEVYVMDWGLARSKEVEDKKDLRIRPTPSASLSEVRTDRRAESGDDSPLLTMDGDVMGTPAYMSPEQARGDQAAMGAHSDVYALGAILYHLMAGHMPYAPTGSKLNAYAIWGLVQNGPPTKLDTIAKDAPVELVAICEKAMARDIARRYPDMGAMAEDLQAYVEGRVVKAHRTGAVVELKKWIVRNRGLAASLAATVVLALGGLGSVGYVEAKGRTAEEVQRKRAESETAKVLRLSDVKLFEELEADADLLWPVHPDNIPKFEEWMERARSLVSTLDGHREVLEEMRVSATPWTAEDQAQDREQSEQQLAPLQAELDQTMARLETSEDEEELIEAEQRLGVLESELEALTWEESRRTWRFETPELQWQHDVLAELIENLERLEADELSEQATDNERRVAQRLAFARGLKRGFDEGGAYDQAWTEALPAIAQAYPGLDLAVQVGLFPLGPDPRSGLWEFAHLTTGAPPARDAAGELGIDNDSAVVLVLLPGGDFWMGAQRDDEEGTNYDPEAIDRSGPVHEVTLSPFFVSKYELTQAQWTRITGSNPSVYKSEVATLVPYTRPHPVETVSWIECVAACQRVGLELPTEAQWEYAARAGTETPWWTGLRREFLDGAANLADQAAKASNAPWGDISWRWPEFNDGYPTHAPVNTLAPNPFGLHHVHGNVYELCRDGASAYTTGPALDPLFEPTELMGWINRGGSFDGSEFFATSSMRDSVGAQDRYSNTGVRPVRTIDE